MTTECVTVLVLCGGAGRRVAGADKPLLPLAGRPLVEHVLDRVTSQVEQVLISANRNLDRYARYGTVVRDDEPDHAGPLSGIHAGLAVCTTDWLLACPGDAPDLPRDLLSRLRQARQPGSGAAAPDGAAVSIDGRLEPLPVLLHRATRPRLDDYLASGGRSVHGWLTGLRLARADFTDCPRAFASLNTPADFEAAHSRICDCR